MQKLTKAQPRSPGVTLNRGALYQKIAIKEGKILQTLFDLLNHSNESIRLGAAKTLINKILPDLKATELTGENNGPILVKIVEDGNRISDQEFPEAAVNL